METISTMSARSLQYYVIARRWVSDLEFFKIETEFLQHLLDQHFAKLCDTAQTDKLKLMSKKLSALAHDEQQADKLLSGHLKHMELMAEEVLAEDAESLAATHVQLEYLMTNLIHEYRDVKKQIFALVAHLIHEMKILN